MADPVSVPPSVPDAGGAARPVVVVLLSDESADGLIDGGARAANAEGGIEWVRWPLLNTRLGDAVGPDSPLSRLADYRWVFAPSPTAVKALQEQMQRLGLDWPSATRAAMTGPGSAATFRRVFGDAPVMVQPESPPYDAEHLLRAVVAADPEAGKGRALVANRRDATPAWLPALSERFTGVDVVPVFEATPVGPPAEASLRLNDWRRAGRPLSWIAGSIDQVERLAAWLAAADPGGWGLKRPLYVPHSRIAQRAHALGFTEVVEFDDRDRLARGLQSRAETPTTGSQLNPSDDRLPVRQAPPTPTPSTASAEALNEVDRAEAGEDVTDARIVGGGTSSTSSAMPAGATPVAATPPSPTPPPPPPPPPSASPSGTAASRSWWPLLLLLIVAGLALAGWWLMQQRFLDLERDGARRVQDAESRVAKMEAQLKSLQDAQGQISSRSGQLEARSGQLEARIEKSADQQEHLQSLYDELAKTRGDTRLAEIEQAVAAAAQYLNLSGNVEAALMSLQAAQGRLRDDAEGEGIGLRRLLAQDVERLKALPVVDLAGTAGRLDGVIARLDKLPLLSEAAMPTTDTQTKPFGPVIDGKAPAAGSPATASPPAASVPGASAPGSAPATAPANGEAAASTSFTDSVKAHVSGWFASLRSAFSDTVDSARNEFRKVISIQRVDNPDLLQLTAEQRQVVRSNVRLQLLNARVNLLNREEGLFRQDLGRGIAELERWFDPASGEVQAAVAALRELQGVPLVLKAPDLTETLTAIRQARATSESPR